MVTIDKEILCLSGNELQYFNRTFRSIVTALTELTRFFLQCTSIVPVAYIPLGPVATCVFFQSVITEFKDTIWVFYVHGTVHHVSILNKTNTMQLGSDLYYCTS